MLFPYILIGAVIVIALLFFFNNVHVVKQSHAYVIERLGAFRKVWGEEYRKGGLILADRYTRSNAVHQAAKVLEPIRPDFFRWLYDLEYVRFGLPVPDLVL